MDCPRCGGGLTPARHETGIAWRCAKCGGESLNFSQFRRMIPEERVDAIWWAAKGQPVASPRGTDCPECARPMLAVLIPFREEELELDICQNCQRLWRDGRGTVRNNPRLDLSQGAAAKPPVLEIRPRQARTPRRGGVGIGGGSAEGRRPFLSTLLVGVVLVLYFIFRGKWRR